MSDGNESSKDKKQSSFQEIAQGIAGIIVAIGGLSGLIAVLQKSPEPQPSPKPPAPVTSPSTPDNPTQTLPREPSNQPRSPSDTSSATAPVSIRTVYAEALRLGSAASRLTASGSNNTLSADEWKKIGQLWQKALNELEKIPPDDPLYISERVNEKIEEYKKNESYANQAELAAPWLQAVRVAENAGILTQTAQTPDDWTKISGLWQQAIELMQSVQTDYVKYSEAPSKISEYQINLKYSQQQQSQV